jgi:hypothetical protein
VRSAVSRGLSRSTYANHSLPQFGRSRDMRPQRYGVLDDSQVGRDEVQGVRGGLASCDEVKGPKISRRREISPLGEWPRHGLVEPSGPKIRAFSRICQCEAHASLKRVHPRRRAPVELRCVEYGERLRAYLNVASFKPSRVVVSLRKCFPVTPALHHSQDPPFTRASSPLSRSPHCRKQHEWGQRCRAVG